jgi:hypothetical protein
METIQAPASFLIAVGELALNVRVMVLQLMPYLLLVLFAWGYISFLFGVNQKFDLKKYLFIPLFLLLLVRFYPTMIDITGRAYAIVINAFDKKEYKKLYTEMLGVTEELAAYNDRAQTELDNQKKLLKRDKEADNLFINLTRTKEQINAAREINKKIDKDLAPLNELDANFIQKLAFDFWDFFSLPTIRIIRYIIDRVRDVFLSLLVIFGCFAIFFESIPAFKGILNKWFKYYTVVTFWALTVVILDGMFMAFIQSSVDMAKMYAENAKELGNYDTSVTLPITAGAAMAGVDPTQSYATVVTDFGEKWYTYGGTEGINKAMQVIMVLCYCMVPYITALYVGGEQTGMFMSKVIGMGSMATRQVLSTSTNVVTRAGKGNIAGVAAGAAAANTVS